MLLELFNQDLSLNKLLYERQAAALQFGVHDTQPNLVPSFTAGIFISYMNRRHLFSMRLRTTQERLLLRRRW